jgi:inner membrane protein
MYRNGHYGAALLAYAPLGAGLLVAGEETLMLAGGAVVLALTPVPDFDQRLPLIEHRGPTHTVAFALLVGLAVGTAGLLVGQSADQSTAVTLGLLGFVVGTLAIVAHLLADAITPSGITPFWPLSDRHYTLSLVTADNTVANYLLLALGVFVTALLLFAVGQ